MTKKLFVVITIAVSVIFLASFSAYAATTWYLAEGSTQDTYETWILIQNTSASSDGIVSLTFYKEDGITVSETITVLRSSRYTLPVNDISGMENAAFGTKIVSSGPDIVVERAMYWRNGGGHDSIGATSTATEWNFAEGCTIGSFTEWISILNPGDVSAICQITLMDSSANPVVHDAFTVNAHSRKTINVNTTYPDFANKSFSAKVATTNDVGIVAERSMYRELNETATTEGTCSVGQASTHYVGEIYGGGIVFYVDHTGIHGLIASSEDLSTTQEWSNIKDQEIGVSAQSTCDGQSNTNAIIGQAGHSASAAQLCTDYSVTVDGVVYDDWYLPAEDELNKLYNNRYEINNVLEAAGDGVTDDSYYWASTEADAHDAHSGDMYYGTMYFYDKGNTGSVRAIREF